MMVWLGFNSLSISDFASVGGMLKSQRILCYGLIRFFSSMLKALSIWRRKK